MFVFILCIGQRWDAGSWHSRQELHDEIPTHTKSPLLFTFEEGKCDELSKHLDRTH